MIYLLTSVEASYFMINFLLDKTLMEFVDDCRWQCSEDENGGIVWLH